MGLYYYYYYYYFLEKNVPAIVRLPASPVGGSGSLTMAFIGKFLYIYIYMYNTYVPLTNLALNAFLRYLFICFNVSFYITVIHKKSMVLILGQSKNISAHNTIYIYIYIYKIHH